MSKSGTQRIKLVLQPELTGSSGPVKVTDEAAPKER